MGFTELGIAARNLLAHTKRTVFLGSAIAAVTGLLILLLGLTAGIEQTMLRSGTVLMTGHVNVGGFIKTSSGQAAPLITDYPAILRALEGHVPELHHLVVRGRGFAKGVAETGGAMDLILGGLEIGRETGFRQVVRPVAGSLDDLAAPRTILLFEEQLPRLQVGVGDTLTLSAPTAQGVNNTVDVRVVAIAKSVGLMSTWNAFVSEQTLLELYRLKPGSSGAIQLYLHDQRDAVPVAARLREVLARAGYRVMEADPQPYYMKLFQRVTQEDWTGFKLDVSTWQDELIFMSWILSALNALTTLLLTILGVIVVIGIMNTLWIAIRERTREIGTLRAIGMQRRGVLRMFLLEAGLLGGGGTLAGAGLGLLVAGGINRLQLAVPESVQVVLMNDTLVLAVQPAAVLGAVVAVSSVTVLAAVYPAIRAARLQPVSAMHHFG
ncbi:MAG: FtsX-like permease family protein [Myxococcota bacterium]|jgi:ABC-type lipoprotein release transport system permease subunit|nr:FtsX-like permease family protein [Myxococcota bacterium]